MASLVVAANVTADFTLPTRIDGYGYSCTPTEYAFIEANTVLTSVSDEDSIPVSLPLAATATRRRSRTSASPRAT